MPMTTHYSEVDPDYKKSASIQQTLLINLSQHPNLCPPKYLHLLTHISMFLLINDPDIDPQHATRLVIIITNKRTTKLTLTFTPLPLTNRQMLSVLSPQT